jgi:pectin methylesterase-like acyl-CoA thioesterase
LFTVLLDFGAGAFSGEARYLEIRVRLSGEGGFTILDPRQALTATPYAIYSQAAPWDGLIGVPDGFADGVDDDTLAELSCSNGQVAKWDGSAWVCAQGSPYANLLVVAQSGGDFSSVQAALDSITDAGAANPYLVYVAPGVYTEQVMLKPYVTLAGAGEGTTILRWMGGSQSPGSSSDSATLVGADNAALRHLTVESDGTGQDFVVAIYNNGASPAISQVTATASGGSNSYGVINQNSSSPTMTNVTAMASGGSGSYGVLNSSSSPTMTNVTATGSGDSLSSGVINQNSSSPMMTNVTATASGGSNSIGVFNISSSPTIRNSLFEGSTYSVYLDSTDTVKVANSQLIGPVLSGLTCFNNYDENLDPVNCP